MIPTFERLAPVVEAYPHAEIRISGISYSVAKNNKDSCRTGSIYAKLRAKKKSQSCP